MFNCALGPLCLDFDPCLLDPCKVNEMCIRFGNLGEYECVDCSKFPYCSMSKITTGLSTSKNIKTTSAPITTKPTNAPITTKPTTAPITTKPTTTPITTKPTNVPITIKPITTLITAKKTTTQLIATTIKGTNAKLTTTFLTVTENKYIPTLKSTTNQKNDKLIKHPTFLQFFALILISLVFLLSFLSISFFIFTLINKKYKIRS